MFFLGGSPLPYREQQQESDDQRIILLDCPSAHVGYLSRSGAVAVDQFLNGYYVITCMECSIAEGAIGRFGSILSCLILAVSARDVF